MAKRMLIDASHEEETRVVIVKGNKLEEFDFEVEQRKPLKGNIYLAKVTRVEPSLQAAFVDFGGNRHGFLAFSEIHPDYYQIPVADREALIAQQRAEEARYSDEDDEEVEDLEVDAVDDDDGDDDLGLVEDDDDQDDDGQDQDGDADDSLSNSSNDDDTDPDKTVALGDEDDVISGDVPETSDIDTDQQPEDNAVDDTVGDTDAAADTSDTVGTETDNRETAAEPVAEPEASGAATDSVSEQAADAETPVSDTPDAEIAAGTDESDAADGDTDQGAETGQAAEEATVQDPATATEDDSSDAEESGDTEGRKKRESRRSSRRGRGRNRRRRGRTDDRQEEDDESVDNVGGDELEEEVQRRRRSPGVRPYKIQEVIKRRQILLVQVVKEERGNKGAALTTYLSLPGRYCVLMPNTARGGGISRKISNVVDRKRLKTVMKDMEVPDGTGVIVRTAGAKRTKLEIRRDFEFLLKLWDDIRDKTLQSTAPALVYEEASLITRSIRDLYSKEIDEVLVEGETGYRQAKDFMKRIMPSHAKKVQPYRDRIPLLHRYQIDDQLDTMYNPEVTLPSGGYIVINPTEALVAIDVNSGKSTKGRSIEETATRTNLEAAEEVARQLRLRDLAGLIVIDYIDMEEGRNNRAVERKMKEALKSDRARIQVGRISHFGLMEMSRQRLRPGVLDVNTAQCQTCNGTGIVRSIDSTALLVLRAIEEEGIRDRAGEIRVVMPTEVAIYIMNKKRDTLVEVEQRYGFRVELAADQSMIPPDYRIERLRNKTAADRQDEEPVEAPAEDTPEIDAKQNDDRNGESEEARDKPKRRRRRRRKPSDRDQDDSDTADNVEESDKEGQAPDTEAEKTDKADEADGADKADRAEGDGDEDGDGNSRRRRRGRRGGRRRRGRGNDENQVAEEGENAESENQDPASDDTGNGDAGSESPANEAVATVAEDAVPANDVTDVATDDVTDDGTEQETASETPAPAETVVEAVEADDTISDSAGAPAPEQADATPVTDAPVGEAALSPETGDAPSTEGDAAPVEDREAEQSDDAAPTTAEDSGADAPETDAVETETADAAETTVETAEPVAETGQDADNAAEEKPEEPPKPKRFGWWSRS